MRVEQYTQGRRTVTVTVLAPRGMPERPVSQASLKPPPTTRFKSVADRVSTLLSSSDFLAARREPPTTDAGIQLFHTHNEFRKG
jgi:hypothetical protein